MQELAAVDYESIPVPRKIKISSKRKITIPVDVYNRHGFAEYALLTETSDGLVIQPMSIAEDDEEITLLLLRYLIDRGCEGEDLLAKFEELRPRFFDYYTAIGKSESDISAGQVTSFADMQNRLERKHGL